MENQPTILDKAVKTSIIIGVLITTLSVAYYLVIFLPSKEVARQDQQKQMQLDKDRKEKENEAKQLIKEDTAKQEAISSKQQRQQDQDDCVLSAASLAEKQLNNIQNYKNSCDSLKGTVAINCYNKSGEMMDEVSKKLDQDKQLCYQQYPK